MKREVFFSRILDENGFVLTVAQEVRQLSGGCMWFTTTIRA